MDIKIQDLAAVEDPNYKARSTHMKFMQQLFLGIGGATVFGLVGALALHGAAIAWPMVLGLSLVGIGCLYLGSMFLADSVQLDQENQARKIGLMNQLNSPLRDVQIEQAKSTPPGIGSANAVDAPQMLAADMDQPSTSITVERALADTIVARGAANENTPVTDKENADKSWEEKMAAQAANVNPSEKARA